MEEKRKSNMDGLMEGSIISDARIDIYGKAWKNKVFSYSCITEIGNDPLCSQFETIGKIQYLEPICTTKGGFSGICYMCSTKGHSKHYCPKQYCSICDAYGHSEKVCNNPKKEIMLREQQQQQLQQYQQQYQSNQQLYQQQERGSASIPFYGKGLAIHVKPFYRRAKHKKNQFGTGWNQQKKVTFFPTPNVEVCL